MSGRMWSNFMDWEILVVPKARSFNWLELFKNHQLNLVSHLLPRLTWAHFLSTLNPIEDRCLV